ncbi:GNAT family N-acetyltransferase [Pseudomonas sp. 7P_10.2_Bac1]|uniref:GNAT family N-acetyltransferase n=1 Tax=Pseudomonas sp. 7P_10.2_Bac1 TaxID=2971614 RepID=UPI0021C9AEEA|nr:GNAT family N-acetyltransferase [Pseudomonas sp. 7P_10.2_Bac1]MCU1728314.1 GNAT family N-acetyltransferase [Pseudomonas sp. 7P_10.2_Bac1]
MTGEQKSNWQKLSTLNHILNWPSGYIVEELQSLEVDELIDKIHQWNPLGVAGEARRFVDNKFYDEKIFVGKDEAVDTQIYIGKFGGDIAFMFCLEHDPSTRTMHGSYGVVAPEHQKSGIGVITVQVIEHQAAALGCSVISSYATLRHPYVQRLLEQRGYKPVGIFPDRDLEVDAQTGATVRVTEVLYVKQLDFPEEPVSPDFKNMTPAVLALHRLIFTGK